jgi:DNA repair exonuclease SbcCD ATPase subunit
MTCPVCGAGKAETVNHCPACKSEWYGGNNDMEKIYRIAGAVLLVLLCAAIGILAINNGRTNRELAELRRDYSELADRNRLLEERIAYYAGLSQFISNEVEQLDQQFRTQLAQREAELSDYKRKLTLSESGAKATESLNKQLSKYLTKSRVTNGVLIGVATGLGIGLVYALTH